MKMVIIVRKNIKMSEGKIISQACHGCLNACIIAGAPRLKAWDEMGAPKVILRSDSSAEMQAMERAGIEMGLPTSLVRDAGRTQVESDTITALVIGPGIESEVDSITRHLKLY